jgi:hypothetical protein
MNFKPRPFKYQKLYRAVHRTSNLDPSNIKNSITWSVVRVTDRATPFSLGFEAAKVSSDSERRCGRGERAIEERKLQRRREVVPEPRGCRRWHAATGASLLKK